MLSPFLEPLACPLVYYTETTNSFLTWRPPQSSWRECRRPKDYIAHKYKLTFLTFSFRSRSSFHLSLFHQITKVKENIFKAIHVFKFSVRRATHQIFKTKWKGRRKLNPQTCNWIKLSISTLKKLKARDVCSLSSPLSLLLLFSYGREGERA